MSVVYAPRARGELWRLLGDVDLSTPEDHGQMTLTDATSLAGSWDDECEGLCGT